MEQEQTPKVPDPRIYVACLAAYNNGVLHGEWLDAAVEEEDLWQGVHGVLATSPVPDAEEHAIHDYEAFQGIQLGEYDSIERVAKIARLVKDHGAAFAAWWSYDTSRELDEAEEAFQGRLIGSFASETELRDHLYDEMGIEHIEDWAQQHTPEWTHQYMQFDMEGYVRDLQLSGEMHVVDDSGTLHAFWTY